MNVDLMMDIIPVVGFVFMFLFVFLIVQYTKIGHIKTKYSRLYRLSMLFLIWGSIGVIIFSIFITNNSPNNSSSSKKADGFTIREFQIVMDVDESNSVNVQETINVHFYEGGHHGIYRSLPYWLKYTNKDGVTQSKKASIRDFKAIGDKYSLDTVEGRRRIRIGDENETIPVGDYTYEISYRYDLGGDSYEGFDEFIFHAFGDFWGTEINNASLIINLPKSINENQIKFYSDKYRKKDITSYVNYYVVDKTIYANVSPNYQLNSSLTIDLELPDGYFIGASNTYGVLSLSLCLLCIIIAFVSIVLWLKYGKDLDKEPETVEFYAPNGLDAAEIGFLYKQDTGRKLAIALIVELASKGFIKIQESKDDQTITITKTAITDIDRYFKREMHIVKLKELNVGIFNKNYQYKDILKKYFPDNSTENTLTTNFNTFLDEAQFLLENEYIKIESDTLDNHSMEERETIRKNLASQEFLGKPKMSSNEKIVYDYLFVDSDETVLSDNKTFYQSFNKVADNVRECFDDKVNDLIAHKYMFFSSLGFCLSVLCFILSYSFFEDLNPKYSTLYLWAFISMIVTFIFSLLMKRRNSYGESIRAKIKGFKNYIELVDKNQIDKITNENANYFYDILPYAYVLGVSKKWINKFEKIPEPINDMGNFSYNSIDSLDSLSSSVYDSSSSGSGGCSSCGGGCSSCGGGGSW